MVLNRAAVEREVIRIGVTFAQEIVISRTDDPAGDNERDGLGAEAALELVQRIHGGTDAAAKVKELALAERDFGTDEFIKYQLGRWVLGGLTIGSREVVLRAMTAAEEESARR
jgi:hypothetical protein